MRAHSLRTRLVAATLLLLAVASAVVAVVTTLALRQFLVSRLDDDLRTAADRISRIRFDPPPGLRLPPVGGELGFQPPGTLSAEIRDGVIVEAWVSQPHGDVRAVPPSEHPALVALSVGARPQGLDLGDLGRYRLVATQTPQTTSDPTVLGPGQTAGGTEPDQFGRDPFGSDPFGSDGTRPDRTGPDGAGPVGTTPAQPGDRLVIGLPESGVQAVVARLVTIELIVAGVALLGAGTAGAVLVRRELRPLERMASTAARVSVLPLDRGEVSLVERVPDVDPRTEVGQVGSALNRMLDHVGAALEARQDSEMQLRQFIADASHELRTPLAAIRGYAELTRHTELPADATHSLSRISSQAARMTTLVEDLLLLARLDAGRPLERGEVDLTRLVLDAVSDAHAAGPEHRWQLALPEEPVTVPGDSARLAQVLANLLANARTHTPAGTLVTVALATAADGVELSVDDDGPGIAADLLPHVFERFARGSTSRSRQNGSTGLGLAIVHAVVAAHGGSVGVTSRPGATRFAVHLPTTGNGMAVPCLQPRTADVRSEPGGEDPAEPV